MYVYVLDICFWFWFVFFYPGFDWGKNVVIFGVDNSSSVHTDNKKKDSSVFGEGPIQGLNGTTITTEVSYSANFWRSQIKLCLRVHHNGSISFLATKIHQFKAKDSSIQS